MNKSSFKCINCRKSSYKRYQCCSQDALFCLFCVDARCPNCNKSKGKKMVISQTCKYCNKSIKKQDSFYDFQYTITQAYYCYLCILKAYERSQYMESFFMPYSKTKYDKKDIIEFLRNFCHKCDTKIKNREQAYYDKSASRYLCSKCAVHQSNSESVSCSICGQLVFVNNHQQLPLCNSCYKDAISDQKQVVAQSILRVSNKQPKSQNHQLDKPQQKRQRQLNVQDLNKKQIKQQKISSKQQINGSVPENTNNRKQQDKVNPEYIVQNVPLSLKQINDIENSQIIECSKCGFFIDDLNSLCLKQKRICRGCYAVIKAINIQQQPYYRKSRVIAEPENRHMTKQKPIKVESPKKLGTKTATKSVFGDASFQTPQLKKLLESSHDKPSYSNYRNGVGTITSSYTTKKCSSCGAPIPSYSSTKICSLCSKKSPDYRF